MHYVPQRGWTRHAIIKLQYFAPTPLACAIQTTGGAAQDRLVAVFIHIAAEFTMVLAIESSRHPRGVAPIFLNRLLEREGADPEDQTDALSVIRCRFQLPSDEPGWLYLDTAHSAASSLGVFY